MTAVLRSNTSANLFITVSLKPVPLNRQRDISTLQWHVMFYFYFKITQGGQCSSTKPTRSKVCKLVFNNARQWSNDKQCNAIVIVTHLLLCKSQLNTKIQPLPNPVGNMAGTSFQSYNSFTARSCSLFKLTSTLWIFSTKNSSVWLFSVITSLIMSRSAQCDFEIFQSCFG